MSASDEAEPNDADSPLEDDSTDVDDVAAAAAAAATAADELSVAGCKMVVVCCPDKPDKARSTALELTLDDGTNDGADNGIGAATGTGADNPV